MTNLDNMIDALRLIRQSNNARISENRHPLQVSDQAMALGMLSAVHQHANPSDRMPYRYGGSIAYDTTSTNWFTGEKANYRWDMRDGVFDGRTLWKGWDDIVSCPNETSVGCTSDHYNMIVNAGDGLTGAGIIDNQGHRIILQTLTGPSIGVILPASTTNRIMDADDYLNDVLAWRNGLRKDINEYRNAVDDLKTAQTNVDKALASYRAADAAWRALKDGNR